jgi:phosphoglycolate phosphatase
LEKRSVAGRFDLLVFDWDGTLMDSAAAIVGAIQAACDDLGVPAPSEERARHVIGLGLQDALRQAVPELPGARYAEMVAAYRRHYLAGDHALALFPGVREMLGLLAERRLLLSVATGKSRLGLDRALATTGVAELFVATRCADECFSKPHPQMLLEIIDETGADPDRVLMIGDTTHDLQMAQAAGVQSLAVTYGAHPRNGLLGANPGAVVDSSAELARWLLANA